MDGLSRSSITNLIVPLITSWLKYRNSPSKEVDTDLNKNNNDSPPIISNMDHLRDILLGNLSDVNEGSSNATD
jgi:hypothetical protein